MDKKRNVKLVAEMGTDKGYFDIYVDFSGQREFLMVHRWNSQLFNLLRSGVTTEALERNAHKVFQSMSLSGHRYKKKSINPRLACRKNQARKFENTINYLIEAMYEHIIYEHDYDELYKAA